MLAIINQPEGCYKQIRPQQDNSQPKLIIGKQKNKFKLPDLNKRATPLAIGIEQQTKQFNGAKHSASPDLQGKISLRPVTACPSLGRRRPANDDELIAIREQALLRVINTKRREKQRKEKELMNEKLQQEEKRIARQIKLSQKERQRSEIYAINQILKRKFDEQYQRFLNSEEPSLGFHTSV